MPQEAQVHFLCKALQLDVMCLPWMEVEFGWGKLMNGQEKFKGKTASLNISVFMEPGNTELTTEI